MFQGSEYCYVQKLAESFPLWKTNFYSAIWAFGLLDFSLLTFELLKIRFFLIRSFRNQPHVQNSKNCTPTTVVLESVFGVYIECKNCIIVNRHKLSTQTCSYKENLKKSAVKSIVKQKK